jgi:UDP-N-acetylmuramoyl-tripeptide--D-alanyl-D-alanine ligase
MKLSTIAECLNQRCDSHHLVEGVCIDSRKICPNQLFVAFSGTSVDGHDFAQDAVNKGALAVIAERPLPHIHVPVFVVDNCLKALTLIAKAYLSTLKITVLALTGSNGKTTVKEMLRCIFPINTFISHGNFNNHLGVPINMMSVKPTDKFAIFELGANQKGDIAHTASLIHPDISLINNIGPAHIGVFGDIDAIATAKGEIYEALSAHGIAVINDDDDYRHYWDNIVKNHQIFRYSSTHETAVWASILAENKTGCCSFILHFGNIQTNVSLQVPGKHQVQNALAAASMAFAAGISIPDIAKGLNAFSGVSGRLRFIEGKKAATIIDDTYNANLESIRKGLEVLATRPGKKIFVMGDIGELGHYAKDHHIEVGKIAKNLGIDELLAVGSFTHYTAEAFGHGGYHFANQNLLVAHLLPSLNQETIVLIKGSRSAKMEDILQKIGA